MQVHTVPVQGTLFKKNVVLNREREQERERERHAKAPWVGLEAGAAALSRMAHGQCPQATLFIDCFFCLVFLKRGGCFV